MTFAQRRNRLTTHFSEHTPVVKRRMTVLGKLLLDPLTGIQNTACSQNKSSSKYTINVFYISREPPPPTRDMQQCYRRHSLVPPHTYAGIERSDISEYDATPNTNQLCVSTRESSVIMIRFLIFGTLTPRFPEQAYTWRQSHITV
jgi:hypothetical protein